MSFTCKRSTSVLLIIKTHFRPPSRHFSFKTATLHIIYFCKIKKGKSNYIYQFTFLRGAYHVDKIWAFLTSYLPLVDICEEIPVITVINQNLHSVDTYFQYHLQSTYVVNEPPLINALNNKSVQNQPSTAWEDIFYPCPF